MAEHPGNLHLTEARLLSVADIIVMGRFSKAYLYTLIKKKRFPQPVAVMGPRFTRWRAADCNQWFDDPAAWIAAHTQGPAA